MIVVRRTIIILISKYNCLIGLVISSRRQVVSVLLTAEHRLLSGFIIDTFWQEKPLVCSLMKQSNTEWIIHFQKILTMICLSTRALQQWPDIARCIIPIKYPQDAGIPKGSLWVFLYTYDLRSRSVRRLCCREVRRNIIWRQQTDCLMTADGLSYRPCPGACGGVFT